MLTFNEYFHIYFYDGKVIPSVSELVDFALGNPYESVPAFVLKQAQEHGTRVHEGIESFLRGEEITLPLVAQWSVDEYKKLHEKHCIEPIQIEDMVHFNGRYAGRYDLLANADLKRTLIDHKTTAKLDKERISWQLSYYRMARESMTGEKISSLACTWLPKEKNGQFTKLKPTAKKLLLENLERYEYVQEQTLKSLPF